MRSVPRAALVVAAGVAAMLSPATAAADAGPADAGTVVHVGAAPGRVLFVAPGDPRILTARVAPARLAGLGRGHRVRVIRGRGSTRVTRTGAGRAPSVSFRATVDGMRRARPLLRLAPGTTIVGPRTASRTWARGDAVRVTWRLAPRTGAIEHVVVVPAEDGTTRVPRPPSPAGPARPAAAPAPAPTVAPAPGPAPAPPAEAPAAAPAAEEAPSSPAVATAAAGGPGAPRRVVFADDFERPVGTPADPAKWVLRGEECDDFTSHSCPKDANVFHDGAGNLVLRARREPAGWLGGGPYSGAFLGTFAYGSGWPPRVVTASWSAPYRIEMRALMPRAPGLWAAAWDMSVDRTPSQGPWELDWAEQRTSHPTEAGCYQHRWVDGIDVAPWWGGLPVTDMGETWHVYSADVSADRVEYRVDGALCGVAPGVKGRFGLLLDLVVGAPGSWGAGGGQPGLDDPGPWDLKIDHVRVTR